MNLLLAIETSARLSSVAIAGPNGLIGEHAEEDGGRTENLHRMIVSLFRTHGALPSEIDGVAVSIGPGSFTGTRIGLAVAKGIALANGCPLVGVPVPHALASAADTALEYEVWLDVGRSEIYRSLVRGDETLVVGRSAPMEEWLAADRALHPSHFIGSGANKYRETILQRWPESVVAEGEANESRARAIATIGRLRIFKGEGEDWRSLEPAYARAADARLPKGQSPVPSPGKATR